jgi:hypothetical protein
MAGDAARSSGQADWPCVEICVIEGTVESVDDSFFSGKNRQRRSWVPMGFDPCLRRAYGGGGRALKRRCMGGPREGDGGQTH